MSRTARRRRGKTLLELVGIMPLIALALGLSAALVAHLSVESRQWRRELARRTGRDALLHAWRLDVHQAVDVQLDGDRLQLVLSDARQVDYELDAGMLRRHERGAPPIRDACPLSPGRWQLDGRLLSLLSIDQTTPDGRYAVQAAVGVAAAAPEPPP